LWKWHALPSTTPSVGGKFPAISFTIVDLPAPLSPINPTTSPALTEKADVGERPNGTKALRDASHIKQSHAFPLSDGQLCSAASHRCSCN
jgi:hypothetical protein